MKRYVQGAVVLLSMLMAAMAWAGDLDVVLAPPDAPVQGGAALVVDLYLHNNTDATISHELPLFLPCRIDMSQETVSVRAELVGSAADARWKFPVGVLPGGSIPSPCPYTPRDRFRLCRKQWTPTR